MNAQQALHTFWSGFGWTAWEENTVPDNAFASRNEYITYSAGSGEFGATITLTASLWQKSTSWAGSVEQSEEIYEAIGRGGKIIPTTDGAIWIKRGTPFAQRMSDEDPTVRRIYLNVEIEFIRN